MKTKISTGQVFLDSDGDKVKVIAVARKIVVLQNADHECVVTDIDAVIQDLASGNLIYPSDARA